MAHISYTNKVALNENPEIANINKVTDDDMNEIKQVVNDNYNNTIQIGTTQPTDSDNKIWINPNDIPSTFTEITNEYSTSTGKGYSADYINKLHTYSTTEQRIGIATNGKPLYKKTFIDTTNSTQHANKVIGTIPNLDTIYNVYGGFKTSAGYGGPVPFYYINKSNNTEYYLVVQNDPSNNIYVVSYYTSTSFVVTFEYTKTTD